MSSAPQRPPKTHSSLVLAGLVALLLEEGSDEAFERLVRLATMALRAPCAVLSLMSESRLYVKCALGLPEPWASQPGQPLPHAIFRHALATSKPFVIEDIRQHPLTRDMTFGEGWEHAAYCGIPLVVSERRVIGVLFAIDRRPRTWADQEVSFLGDLATSAVQEIEARLGPDEAEASPEPEPAALPGAGSDAFFAVDADWRFTVVNARAERVLGRNATELVGASLFTIYPGLMGTLFHQEWLRAFAEGSTVEFEDRFEPLGLWFEARAYPFNDGLAVHLRDVTARRNAEEALRYSEARYRGVFQEARDPIFFTAADGSFTECNRAMLDVFGYRREELFRRKLGDLVVDAEERERFLSELGNDGAVTDYEIRLRTRDGAVRECLITAFSQRAADGELLSFQGIIEDTTTRREAEQRLLHNAFHDPLTALPNRALFMDRLEREIVQVRRHPEQKYAVLFVDLDRFKLINDTLGHLAGDELLSAVARRLENCLRQEDTVARFGGDEFAILLEAIPDVRDATRVAERINLELALPFRVGRREVACSASIGIALSATGYERAEDALHDADAAMYRAKGGGRERYEVFDTGMHARALTDLQLEADLRDALAGRQFTIHYQPVVSLDGGAVASFEALLRWHHPTRGLLLPDEFMAVAERTGIIVEIGWFVLEAAGRQMAEWQRQLPSAAPLAVSVNLSARQFMQPDLVERIDAILAATGLDPARLRLEVTEAVVMRDAERVTDTLARLRERAIGICLDDFGTGLSSLRDLRRFPISTLKIDRSFVHGISENGTSRGVIGTIIALGQSLSLDSVAEGVETLEQLQALRELGAGYAQGFLFSEPLDAEAASELVLDRARR